jgi:tRNA (adenine57-N1/adenine58-N1)-methyltransferase catalytic subunit
MVRAYFSLGLQPYVEISLCDKKNTTSVQPQRLEANMTSKVSPFLSPGSTARADTLAIIHLKRDYQIPTILKVRDDDDEGYYEGKVVNTQFGSYPHKTLIGLPWGSQVRASRVDTGSRGRRIKSGDKRKRDPSEALETDQQEDTSAPGKAAVTASSGFIHVLAPTPENWTSSLPHRTQVVYTPDYSYILHRLRARPGTSIIEAGAGSGSFTHASARAVYSGYPSTEADGRPAKKPKLGKVWSFEFHEQRHGKLVKEIQDHGLEGIVEITHRDVCRDGFLVGTNGNESPIAEAIFLDLPAPWLALPHLTRRAVSSKSATPTPNTMLPTAPESKPHKSPLNPQCAVRICTFSPCIEQVQRTVSVLRRLGWTDISMEEVTQKRLEIRRERVGIENGLQRGVLPVAANIEEAVARLKEVEGRFKAFHGQNGDDAVEAAESGDNSIKNDKKNEKAKIKKENPNSRGKILESLVERKVYKEGRLTHRSEPEVKTHTSYLVFAVLPREWSAEDEERVRANWPTKKKDSGTGAGDTGGLSRKQMKKAARQAQKEPSDWKDRRSIKEEAAADAAKALGDITENLGNADTVL